MIDLSGESVVGAQQQFSEQNPSPSPDIHQRKRQMQTPEATESLRAWIDLYRLSCLAAGRMSFG